MSRVIKITLCQLVAASIVHGAGVDAVTHFSISHEASFTHTLVVARSDVYTVCVGTATSSGVQLTVVQFQTHQAIAYPSLSTHTRNIAWTPKDTLCIKVTASTVARQARVSQSARVAVALVAVFARTREQWSNENTDCVDVTINVQPVGVAEFGSLVAQVPREALLTGPLPTHTTTAWTVVTHAVHTVALFVTVVAMFVWILADMAGDALEAGPTAA